MEQFLQDSEISRVEALTIGMLNDVFEIEDSEYIVNYLVNAKDKISNLKALFIDLFRSEKYRIW